MRAFQSRIAELASKDVDDFLRGRACRLTRQLDSEHVSMRAYRVLTILNASDSLVDLKVFGGMRVEALKGDREGYYSIRLNEKWRLTFRLDRESGRYFDVDISPHYHD